jgi:hypothetical protein
VSPEPAPASKPLPPARLGALAAALSAAIALSACGDGGSPAAPTRQGSVQVQTAEAVDPAVQQAAEAAAEQFISAVNSDDIDALYDLQESSYREACHPDDFPAVVAPLLRTELIGPPQVEVSGNEALAQVLRRFDDGTEVQQTLQLALDVDRTWRVKAPIAGACGP